MYGLYDINGVLRFINSDKEACLAYARLFDLDITNYSLLNLVESVDQSNLDLNQAKNSN